MLKNISNTGTYAKWYGNESFYRMTSSASDKDCIDVSILTNCLTSNSNGKESLDKISTWMKENEVRMINY